MVRIIVNYCPVDDTLKIIFRGWQVYSFLHRLNYKDPNEFGLYYDEEADSLETTNIGLRRKLEVGLAFVLSYYEHSGGTWGREGTLSHWPDAMWDCTRFAGIAIWVDKPRACPEKEYHWRAQLLDEYLKDFNAVWNGEAYTCLIDDDGDVKRFGPGCYLGPDLKNMAKDIARIVGDRPVRIVGDVPSSVREELLERIEEYRVEEAKAKEAVEKA
jgi:hypothetical protein